MEGMVVAEVEGLSGYRWSQWKWAEELRKDNVQRIEAADGDRTVSVYYNTLLRLRRRMRAAVDWDGGEMV